MGHRGQAEIRELLEAYGKRGNQTRAAFCEQRGVSITTLDYYQRRYGKQSPARVRLKRVEVKPEPGTAMFTLRLANGRRIECGEAALAQMIRIAERA